MAYGNYFPVGYQPAYPYQVQQQQIQPTMAANIQPPSAQLPQPPQAQSFQMFGDMIFVNGREEADAWVVQRGQTVHLWDRNANKFYVKSVGENGMPNPVEIYTYCRDGQSEQQPQQGQQKTQGNPDSGLNPSDFVSREEFEKLKRQLEELMAKASGNTSTKGTKEGTNEAE